jgi:pimeloyl-ACP methyl ester carboxylesterase
MAHPRRRHRRDPHHHPHRSAADPRRRRLTSHRATRRRRVRSRRAAAQPIRFFLASCVALAASACGEHDPRIGVVEADEQFSVESFDVGGHDLTIQCIGEGTPIVVLEAGLDASGTDAWFMFQSEYADTTRMCTYDRAGIGRSDARRSGSPTGSEMADELHALLEAAGEQPPYVLVGHSFGGMVVRLFADAYPEEVVGIVLEESSQEDEIDAYREIRAGPWIDGGVRIDIEDTERALRNADDLGDLPLIVVTAENYEDVLDPAFAFRMQERLAGLSSNVVHVVAEGSGHFVHEFNPPLIARAVQAVIAAARPGTDLPPCEETFADLRGRCVTG